jgi:hypothetical protein
MGASDIKSLSKLITANCVKNCRGNEWAEAAENNREKAT